MKQSKSKNSNRSMYFLLAASLLTNVAASFKYTVNSNILQPVQQPVGTPTLAPSRAPSFSPSLWPTSSPTVIANDTQFCNFCGIDTDLYLDTVCGTGDSDYDGDHGKAKKAKMKSAYSVWYHKKHKKFYTVDFKDHRVRCVDDQGDITTVIGTGHQIFKYEGGLGSSHDLFSPWGCVGDHDNDFLFVSDKYHIWRYNITSGLVDKYAGADDDNEDSDGDGGDAKNCHLDTPAGMWLTPEGVLYCAESGGHKIRKIDIDGTISTCAGSGVIGFGGDGELAVHSKVKLSSPCGVYVDVTGNVFIADQFNNRVRVVIGGIIHTFAGGGSSTLDNILATDYALGIIGDCRGDKLGENIFISDSSNHKILKVHVSTGEIKVHIGNGFGSVSIGIHHAFNPIKKPMGMWFDDDDCTLYEVESTGCVVKRSLYVCPPSAYPTESPIVVPDQTNAPVIVTVNPSASPVYSVAPTAAPVTKSPTRLPTFAPTLAPTVAVNESALCNICGLDTDIFTDVICGTGDSDYFGDNGKGKHAKVKSAYAVWHYKKHGRTFLVDNQDHRVRCVDDEGEIVSVIGTGHQIFHHEGGLGSSHDLYSPWGCVGDNDNDLLFVSDKYHIWRYNITSGIVDKYAGADDNNEDSDGDGGDAKDCHLDRPAGMWLTPEGVLYCAESGHDKVRMIAVDGTITTIAGSGVNGFGGDGEIAISSKVKLSAPCGVYVNEFGNVYIADQWNNRVRVVISGMIHTFAGGGHSTANGVLATDYALGFVGDCRGDKHGENIFITDFSNHKIMKVHVSTGVISVHIGTGVAGITLGIQHGHNPIQNPLGIWFDEDDCTLYETEATGCVVKRSLYMCPPSASPTMAPFVAAPSAPTTGGNTPSAPSAPTTGGNTPSAPSAPTTGGNTPSAPSAPTTGGNTPSAPSAPTTGGNTPSAPSAPTTGGNTPSAPTTGGNTPSAPSAPTTGGNTPSAPSAPTTGGNTPSAPSAPTTGGNTPSAPSAPTTGGNTPSAPTTGGNTPSAPSAPTTGGNTPSAPSAPTTGGNTPSAPSAPTAGGNTPSAPTSAGSNVPSAGSSQVPSSSSNSPSSSKAPLLSSSPSLSVSPTVNFPTNRPSVNQPSGQPSAQPSSQPSSQPSASPSSPTFKPTNSPSAHDRVLINGKLILKKISCDCVNSTRNVLKEAILNISSNPHECDIQNAKKLLSSVFRPLALSIRAASASSDNYEVDFMNVYEMFSYPGLNSTYLAALKTKLIKAAVVDGRFEDALRYAAAKHHVAGYSNVTCDDVALTTTIVSSDGDSSSSSSSSTSLSTGAIAGITVGCFVASVLVFLVARHFVLKSNSNGEPGASAGSTDVAARGNYQTVSV
jgi:hypothetical protein